MDRETGDRFGGGAGRPRNPVVVVADAPVVSAASTVSVCPAWTIPTWIRCPATTRVPRQDTRRSTCSDSGPGPRWPGQRRGGGGRRSGCPTEWRLPANGRPPDMSANRLVCIDRRQSPERVTRDRRRLCLRLRTDCHCASVSGETGTAKPATADGFPWRKTTPTASSGKPNSPRHPGRRADRTPPHRQVVQRGTTCPPLIAPAAQRPGTPSGVAQTGYRRRHGADRLLPGRFRQPPVAHP
jgi:hypothetical protein